MNIDDGYIRPPSTEHPIRPHEVPVPEEDFEKVINLSRADRRRWARAQRKAQKKVNRG